MVKKSGNNTGLIIALGGAGLAILFGLIAGSAKPGQATGAPDIAPNNTDATVEDQVVDALRKISQLYGVEFARKIEQILRWETAHFSSESWIFTNTAGMEATNGTFPYGWTALAEFVETSNFDLVPSDFTTAGFNENGTGIFKQFVVFPNAYYFVIFLAWFIMNKRGGRAGYWYSLDEDSATRYEQKISGVNTPFVDQVS